MKRAQEIVEGTAQLSELEEYLSRRHSSVQNSSFVDWKSVEPRTLVEDFEHVARSQVFFAFELLEERRRTMSAEQAWNESSIELCRASRLHVKAYLIRNYFGYISRFDGSASIAQLLIALGKLFALDQISDSLYLFAQKGFYSERQSQRVRLGIQELLGVIRPNAVALVDSFDFSDRELHSVLGRRDGNVYPALLAWAQQSPLNESDVLPAFHKHLGPMMREGRAKL